MYKLDENFLDDLGLGALPQDAKQDFLQHIYGELESRTGEALTEGMSDEQLDEFGIFVDQDAQKIDAWFAENLPDYQTREDYSQLKDAAGDAAELDVKSQYGAMKWLQLNRPDYPQVVAQTLDGIRNEIIANKDAILGGVAGANNS